MARDPEAERQAAAELITLLLQERQRRQKDKCLSTAHNQQISRIISHVHLWKHSEAEGDKYKGCRYWSEGALQSQHRHGKVDTDHRRVGGDALRHEHLFPRKQLIAKLFSISEPNATEVRTLLGRLNIAVIVTMDEDKILPREGDETDPWDRYRKTGIRWQNICEPTDAV